MSEKLALTPYDVAVLTAAGQGLLTGVHRAQRPESAGEPALERGIGQGLTATLGHLTAALPTAYALRGAGPLASSAAATMAGLAGGAVLPALKNRATQLGSEMTGGRVRTAAELAKAGASAGCSYAGSMGDGEACPKCKKPHPPKVANFTYDANQPLPTSVSLSAAAQPPPGSIASMDMGMGSMGTGFPQLPPPRRVKPPTKPESKPKEGPPMKSEAKTEKPADKPADKPAEKEASGDAGTFMSGFMGKWRATTGKPMSEKVALLKKSGFNAAMKRSE